MKRSSIVLLVGLLLVPTSLYVFHGVGCGAKVTFGGVHRGQNGVAIAYVKDQMWGPFFTSMSTSMNDPIGMNVDLRSVGDYRFNYSENIRKIAIRKGSTKMYEGPPIASLKIGPGKIGIDIESYTDGDVWVEAIGLCTAGSLVESFQ